ncbi:MAG: 50S ribosomal protein L19 [Candidatus Levybacteria bacterium]|nr:50S ribosomal protein L19 [Candidatus Levybacteria bacterium]MBI2421173.1 50S ribosomal protein L19 [Candidatus Levybacteria bacterium]
MLKTIDFRPGDIIRVFSKIREGEKTRTQVFEGAVLQIKGRGENKTFTVRKMVGGTGVERIWPVNSPNIEDVKLKEHPKKTPRRARLYHLRSTK